MEPTTFFNWVSVVTPIEHGEQFLYHDTGAVPCNAFYHAENAGVLNVIVNENTEDMIHHIQEHFKKCENDIDVRLKSYKITLKVELVDDLFAHSPEDSFVCPD